MSDKITLTQEEKERLKAAAPYLKNEQWNNAFVLISNWGYRTSYRDEPIHILSFLNEHNIDLWHKVTDIPSNAFRQCRELESIEIPDNVTFIGENAFTGCSNLHIVVLPNSIKYLDEGIFTACKKLNRIKYDGTREEWEKIEKKDNWDENSFLSYVEFLR